MFRAKSRSARLVQVGIICVTLAGGPMIAVSPAAAQSSTYSIEWTHIGIFPRTSTEMRGDNKMPQAISDGTLVTIECETTGASVTSDAGTSNIWGKTNVGFIPNVFINTGEASFTSGVPKCVESVATPKEREWSREQMSAAERDNKDYQKRGKSDPQFDQFLGEVSADTTYLGPELYNYFYSKKGGMVYIPWSYFENQERFVSWLKKLPKDDKTKQYHPNAVLEHDLYVNLGTFGVARTGENCFSVRDLYDFAWYELNLYGDQQSGKGKIFASRSAGCLS